MNLSKVYIQFYDFFLYANGCYRLEHGVYNLSRMRESASKRYRGFQIPMDWMLETGIVSQVSYLFPLLCYANSFGVWLIQECQVKEFYHMKCIA